jgi:hypothetical protein
LFCRRFQPSFPRLLNHGLHRGQATCHAHGSNQTAPGARQLLAVHADHHRLPAWPMPIRDLMTRDVEIAGGSLLVACETVHHDTTATPYSGDNRSANLDPDYSSLTQTLQGRATGFVSLVVCVLKHPRSYHAPTVTNFCSQRSEMWNIGYPEWGKVSIDVDPTPRARHDQSGCGKFPLSMVCVV